MNKGLLQTLNIPFPDPKDPLLSSNIAGKNNKLNSGTAFKDVERQFTFISKPIGGAGGGRMNTMVNRNQGYQNIDNNGPVNNLDNKLPR